MIPVKKYFAQLLIYFFGLFYFTKFLKKIQFC